MVTKVGPMQDSMASGSNPADAQGPGFALTDEHQRPLFVFIFENQAQRDAAAKQLGAILKTTVWAGPSAWGRPSSPSRAPISGAELAPVVQIEMAQA